MLRVLCCGHIEVEQGGSLAAIVQRCAEAAGLGGCSVESFDAPLDLLQAYAGDKGDSCVDLAICPHELPGMTGLDLIRELRDEGYAGRAVLCSGKADAEAAARAFSLHVDRLLAEPVDVGSAERAFSAVLRKVAKDRLGSVDLRSREGLRRIRLAQVLYAATEGHDQRLFFADGGSLTVRASSQALYALLEPSGLFFKAGSSYIVNLGAVRLVDAKSSLAVLADGTSIPVPGRFRKALEAAILAYGASGPQMSAGSKRGRL